MSSRPDFTQSAQTRSLVAVFARLSIGETLSFGELSRKLGFEVGSASPAYQSARRIAHREHQVVTASVRGVGIKRLSGPDIVEGRSEQHFAAIRRRTRRLHDELGTAMLHNLPAATMAAAMEKQGRAGVILMNAAPSRTNRVVVETMPKPKEPTPQ